MPRNPGFAEQLVTAWPKGQKGQQEEGFFTFLAIFFFGFYVSLFLTSQFSALLWWPA